MKQLIPIAYKCALGLALGLLPVLGQSQKHTKTYDENFSVDEDVVLDINTSNADIVFDTWNKKQVQISATVSVEGLSEEEAQKYLERQGLEIIGNSEKINIKTRSGVVWDFRTAPDFEIAIPPIPPIEVEIPEIPEIAAIPPMPPMPPIAPFDYSRYEAEGQEYLKEWQKGFSKNFDKEYESKMEAWAKKVEEKAMAMESRQEAREEQMEERVKARAKVHEERAKALEERIIVIERERANRQRVLVERQLDSMENVIIMADTLHRRAPNVFFFSPNKGKENVKVAIRITVKMPKSARLQLNVRHGEVKLADNARDLKANLSYTSLLAKEIVGENTVVSASYSPVVVEKWQSGRLQADFSDGVRLQEVRDLKLHAVSSEVTIDKILNKAYVSHDLGGLTIKAIDPGFDVVDVSLENSEMECSMPSNAYRLYVNGRSSKVQYPNTLQMETQKNGSSVIYTGYNQNKTAKGVINVTSKYSNVQLQ